ncbi:MAG: rod shape-determining protein RodA [Bacteroidales bacterium]|nr:rod shape-determining protein RodA [Bacteroidales bacterium]
MREQRTINVFGNLDWLSVLLYLALLVIGLVNIYAANYDAEHTALFDLTQKHGKQLMWTGVSLVIAIFVLLIDARFFANFSYPIYIMVIISLVAVLFFGKEIGGSRSWFQIGGFALQPAEFAKFATSLAIARFLSSISIHPNSLKNRFFSVVFMGIPLLLILAQNDTGSALVFLAFIIVLYREGLSGNILVFGIITAIIFLMTLLFEKLIIIGVLGAVTILMMFFIQRNTRNVAAMIGLFILAAGFSYSVDYGFNNFLEPHQQTRINVLLGKDTDVQGAGYNVNQSKIAIGSGGFSGKGFLKGTQTKYNFVPEQSTDFIFCTVGEEWGFIGSSFVVIIFALLLVRIIMLAEKQRSGFSRIYGYCVAAIFFTHFAINIGMTIGLAPVIGIPLPFISYGGSSLIAFTFLLFVFLKQDTVRNHMI